jgi:hypothetical protein
VDDGLGVVEKGIDDDAKEVLVVRELLIEVGRLDHVEPAEELKVEDALIRSPAEPVMEPGRCGVGDSTDVPMLF